MTVFKWSTTAASNATADSTVNAREGMAPSQVNDAMRAMMAAISKWRDDLAGTILTGGTSTAYTITTSQGFTALASGLVVCARVHATNGAAPTLNVDSLGAKAIASTYGAAIGSGRLKTNRIYTFTYNAADNRWIVIGLYEEFATGDTPLFFQAAAPTGYTKQTTESNKGLRITSGTGGGTGGTRSFTSTFTSRTITQSNLPSYTLPNTLGASTSLSLSTVFIRGGILNTAQSGVGVTLYSDTIQSSLSATTTITGSVTSGGSGAGMDFDLQYIDVIACVKD